MSTLYLTDTAVSSHYDINGQGWMHVYLNDGHILTVHCPQVTDNWALQTKRVCTQVLGKTNQTFEMKSLLLQPVNNGGYVILQGQMYSPQYQAYLLFDIPASEIKYMINQVNPQKILGADFLMIACVIFGALSLCKYLLEKYLLPKFSD